MAQKFWSRYQWPPPEKRQIATLRIPRFKQISWIQLGDHLKAFEDDFREKGFNLSHSHNEWDGDDLLVHFKYRKIPRKARGLSHIGLVESIGIK